MLKCLYLKFVLKRHDCTVQGTFAKLKVGMTTKTCNQRGIFLQERDAKGITNIFFWGNYSVE